MLLVQATKWIKIMANRGAYEYDDNSLTAINTAYQRKIYSISPVY